MRQSKIALIGGGNIGGTLAHLAIQRHLGEIVLIDISEGIPQGKTLDLTQSFSVDNLDATIQGGQDYSLIKDADVVIVSAGVARKQGMSRDDLLSINGKIIASIGEQIKMHAPSAFVIVITNPLDVMVWLMQKTTGFKHAKVVGMAGILDTGRFKSFLSQALNVSVQDIQSFVLGGHGDSMVPMPRYTSVSGIPLAIFINNGWISQKQLDVIIERTRNGGAEIVNHLKTGSAFYAPAASALQMATSYLKGQKRILPCAAYLNGEYGVSDIYLGVPVIIGGNGVEKIIEVPLDEFEKKQLDASIESVKTLIRSCADLRL